MNTQVVLKVDFGAVIGKTARSTLFGIIDAFFTVGIAEQALETGYIGVCAIETDVRALSGSINKEVIEITGIHLAGGTRTIASSKTQVTPRIASGT